MNVKAVGRLLAILLVGFVASGVGAGATVLGAVATGSVPAAFLIGVAGVITSAASLWAWVWRVRCHSRRKGTPSASSPLPVVCWRKMSVVSVAVALIVSASWAAPRSASPESAPMGSEIIPLPDGTHLVASIARPVGTASSPPVIFVHGGPGISDTSNDFAALRPIARDRVLVVYDQIGAGASSRLPSPTDYTLARSVADLDAVLDYIGADSAALIGHSWGARIVTAYLAIHPARVSSVVLTAPGPPAVTRQSLPAPDPVSHLTQTEKARLYLSALEPRTFFTYVMGLAAPAIAADVVGDGEADRIFSGLYRYETPALFCDPANAKLAGVDGVGFYSWLGSQREIPDPRVTLEALAAESVPVLVIRPRCDYIPKVVAQQYVALLPNSTLKEVPGGHLAYREKPDSWDQVVRDFLRSSG